MPSERSLAVYQIDAFSATRFGGNPAAVVPLTHWLDDELMQSIAAENNLSETAFLVPAGTNIFDLRWFTPRAEIELCGHATLASAWYLFNLTSCKAEVLHFNTLSGTLAASRRGEQVEIDLPSRPSQPDETLRPAITAAVGAAPTEVFNGANAIALFDSQSQIESIQPDFRLVAEFPHGLIISAPGDHHDFVSRFFVPRFGIDEDPVTGSAHADLTPIWSQKLGKTKLRAKQVSQRGGELLCRLEGNRVFLTGACALYLRGEILI